MGILNFFNNSAANAAAKCLNETIFSTNGEAHTLLNEVRQRADLLSKAVGNAIPALNVFTQAAFRQAVWRSVA